MPEATLPLPGGSRGAEVRVHPLLIAEVPAPPEYFDRGSGRAAPLRATLHALRGSRSRWALLPFPAFLVEHPTAGPFMVDTGVSAKHADGRGKEDIGAASYVLTRGMRMTPSQAAGEQVRALGHDPSTLPLVVMTHLHYDHLGGSDQFPAATFLTHRRDLDDPPGAAKGTYARHRDAVREWRTFAGDERIDLFGDGSVVLWPTPGHTPGHTSLILRLEGGRTALLAADAAYTRRTIDRRQVPILCPDVPTYLRSLDAIGAWVGEHPDAVVVCGHDPECWAQASATLAAPAGS